jgi:hypothetical protein
MVLHLEAGLSMPAAKKVAVAEDSTMECAPAAAARSTSPPHSAVAARCELTMEEEHAVSTDSAGPCIRGAHSPTHRLDVSTFLRYVG